MNKIKTVFCILIAATICLSGCGEMRFDGEITIVKNAMFEGEAVYDAAESLLTVTLVNKSDNAEVIYNETAFQVMKKVFGHYNLITKDPKYSFLDAVVLYPLQSVTLTYDISFYDGAMSPGEKYVFLLDVYVQDETTGETIEKGYCQCSFIAE